MKVRVEHEVGTIIVMSLLKAVAKQDLKAQVWVWKGLSLIFFLFPFISFICMNFAVQSVLITNKVL